MLYRQAILRGAALAFLFCGVTTSLACRFNVRDVGFVDLGSKPYQLFCYVERNTPQELISQIEDISLAALLDSNIETEVVNVDQQDAHPSHAYLTNANLKKLPIAALVSPDGRSIPLTLLDD